MLLPISAWGYDYQNSHLQDKNGNDFGSTSNPVHVSLSGAAQGYWTVSADTTSIYNNNNSGTGNVGINNATPGAQLDVTGTVRTVGFTMSGNTPVGGYVLTAIDSTGAATWNPAAGSSGWTLSGSSLYPTSSTTNVSIGTTITTNALNIATGGVSIGTAYVLNTAPTNGMIVQGPVGIGTNNIGNAALYTMGGNVGIGTWNPSSFFQVGTTGYKMSAAGSVTTINNTSVTYNEANLLGSASGTFPIGNGNNTAGANTVIRGGAGTGSSVNIQSTTGVGSGDFIKFTGGNAGATEIARFLGTGNVGINSASPGQMLDVKGTIRVIGGSGAASTATCWCADGQRLGHGSSVVGAGGGVTCNDASGVC